MPVDTDPVAGTPVTEIKITAHGDRRMLETVYLELRELAQQNGLKIEYRLNLTEPEEQADSG